MTTSENIIEQYRNNNGKSDDSLGASLYSMAESLYLPDEVVREAVKQADMFIEETHRHGLDRNKIVLAMLYITAERKGMARSKRQIQREYNNEVKGVKAMQTKTGRSNNRSKYSVKDIRKSTKMVQNEFDCNRKFRMFTDYKDYWLKAVSFESEIQKQLLDDLLQYFQELDHFCGYAPLPFSGAIVWLLTGKKYSQNTIADMSVSTRQTIRTNVKDIKEELQNYNFSQESYCFENQLEQKIDLKEVTN